MVETDEQLRRRAAAWFARLRAPGGENDSAAFEAWRAADVRNAAAYERLEQRWRTAAHLRRSHLSEMSQLRPGWLTRLSLRRPRMFTSAFAVTAFVIVIGVAIVRQQRLVAASPGIYASNLGEIRTITLADGSRVTLDTQSAVTEMFTAGERQVRLDRGRARFDVVHDTTRPFAVLAGATRIVDQGTVFDVRLRDRAVEIFLLRGRVEVDSRRTSNASLASPSLIITTGQRATVSADRTPVLSSQPAPRPSTWVTGMLDFSDVRQTDMLDEVNRYNARHILLGDPNLSALRVTGSFRANAPADIARNLAALFQLRVRTDPQGNWVLLRSDGITTATAGTQVTGRSSAR